MWTSLDRDSKVLKRDIWCNYQLLRHINHRETDKENKFYILDVRNILFSKMYRLAHDHKFYIGKEDTMSMFCCLLRNLSNNHFNIEYIFHWSNRFDNEEYWYMVDICFEFCWNITPYYKECNSVMSSSNRLLNRKSCKESRLHRKSSIQSLKHWYMLIRLLPVNNREEITIARN